MLEERQRALEGRAQIRPGVRSARASRAGQGWERARASVLIALNSGRHKTSAGRERERDAKQIEQEKQISDEN